MCKPIEGRSKEEIERKIEEIYGVVIER